MTNSFVNLLPEGALARSRTLLFGSTPKYLVSFFSVTLPLPVSLVKKEPAPFFNSMSSRARVRSLADPRTFLFLSGIRAGASHTTV